MRRAIRTKRQEKVVTVETVQGDPLLPIPDGFDRNRLEKAKNSHRTSSVISNPAADRSGANGAKQLPTDRGNSHPTETGAGCLNALGQSSDH
jgi:hypothetical protein